MDGFAVVAARSDPLLAELGYDVIGVFVTSAVEMKAVLGAINLFGRGEVAIYSKRVVGSRYFASCGNPAIQFRQKLT
jgi:hypothetical protein